MNIYEKIQIVKSEILKANPKKSGKNKFANYDYYELADIMPIIIESCKEHKLLTFPSFTNDVATLTAINAEAPEEKVVVESPMRDLDIKGANAIQSLGGIETYQRRYLYMALFDITENDMFDATTTERNPATEKKTTKKTDAPATVKAPTERKADANKAENVTTPPACEECGQVIEGFGKMNADEMAAYTKQKYNKCLCADCAQKAAAKKG